jgi:hypothetical protein
MRLIRRRFPFFSKATHKNRDKSNGSPIMGQGGGDDNNVPTMASVHGNLMRSITQQDPFQCYDVLSEMGKGSMVRQSPYHCVIQI